MPKVVKNCEECGAEFSRYPSQGGRFCCIQCQCHWMLRTGQPMKPRRGSETPCETCGKPVYATASARANGQGRFCSQACHNVSQTKEPVRKECAYCGKPLNLRPSAASIQYCSRECMGNAKTKRPLDRVYNGKRARVDALGYVQVWGPDHPKALKGWVREHQIVAEASIGRYLQPGEDVHHINGVRDDNRPENLIVLGKSEHCAETAANNWGRLKTDRDELEEYRKRFGPLTE